MLNESQMRVDENGYNDLYAYPDIDQWGTTVFGNEIL